MCVTPVYLGSRDVKLSSLERHEEQQHNGSSYTQTYGDILNLCQLEVMCTLLSSLGFIFLKKN